MKHYKLNHISDCIRFSVEEVGFILCYRFNAEQCSSDIIQKEVVKDGIGQVTYRIRDKELLSQLHTQEECEELEARILLDIEEGREATALQKGEEYIINMEYREDGSITNFTLVGDLCRYIFEETLIFQGNDFESQCRKMLISEPNDDESKQMLKAFIGECKEYYMRLLETHGYI